MLLYKAWKETQWRYLISLVLVILPSYDFLTWKKFLLPGDLDGRPAYLKALFNHHVAVALIWIISAVFLGLGGLVRERAVGSSAFTLTLPVGRAKLVAVRAAVGFLEAITLAIVPWVINFLISGIRQTPFSLAQASYCILLLTAGGIVYFSLAILISSIFEGEYTAAAIAYGLVILSLFLSESVSHLKALNLVYVVTGLDYINKQTFEFSGPPPWFELVATVSIAVVMLLTSIVVTKQKDF